MLSIKLTGGRSNLYQQASTKTTNWSKPSSFKCRLHSVTKTLIWDGESCSHLEFFHLSSNWWKQQLPVLLITVMERLTGTEIGEKVGEGVKQEHRSADHERNLSKRKTTTEIELRQEIWQWTAKAYKSCSADKMVKTDSLSNALNYLLSQHTPTV